jgi:hypothetical protein
MTLLHVVPPSAVLYEHYRAWWQAYYSRGEIPVPFGSRDGIWIAAKSPNWEGPVSGCQLYPCGDAPRVLVDGFCVNPEAPGRLRLQALRLTVEQVVAYSAMSGRAPVVHSRFRSVVRQLERFGFRQMGGLALMLAVPVLRGSIPDPPRVKKQSRRPRRKPPIRRRRR